jgi:hypothetical protein
MGFLFADPDATTVEDDTGAFKGTDHALKRGKVAAPVIFQVGNGGDGYSGLIG